MHEPNSRVPDWNSRYGVDPNQMYSRMRDENQDEISLGEYVKILRRRAATVWTIFFVTAFLGVSLAYGFNIAKKWPIVGGFVSRHLLPNIYRSRGQFLVDVSRINQVSSKQDDKLDELLGGSNSNRFIETQMKVAVKSDIVDPDYANAANEALKRLEFLNSKQREQLLAVFTAIKPLPDERAKEFKLPDGFAAQIDEAIASLPLDSDRKDDLRISLTHPKGIWRWHALDIVDSLAGDGRSNSSLSLMIDASVKFEELFNAQGDMKRSDINFIPPANEDKIDIINMAADSRNRGVSQAFVTRWMRSYLHWDEANQEKDMVSPIQKAQQELVKARKDAMTYVRRVEEFKKDNLSALKYMAVAEEKGADSNTKASGDTAGKALAQLEQQEQGLQATLDGQTAQVQKVRTSLDTLRQNQPNMVVKQYAPNPAIAKLSLDLMVATSQLQKDLSKYRDDHPVIRQDKAQVQSIQIQLKEQPQNLLSTTSTTNPEIAKVESELRGLEAQKRATEGAVQTVRKQKNEALSELKSLGGKRAELVQLITDRDVQQDKVRFLVAKLNDLQLQNKTRIAPVSVLTPADLPEKPEKPNRPVILVMALIAGLFLGICMAILQEFLDDSLPDVQAVEKVLPGIPMLGVIPMIRQKEMRLLTNDFGALEDQYDEKIAQARSKGELRKLEDQRKKVEGTHSNLLETFRNLRSNVQFTSAAFVQEHPSLLLTDGSENGAAKKREEGDYTPPIAIMITSSRPGEGKSSTAINLAATMAVDGKRVILVDTDLRRPTIHRKFKNLGIELNPGLTDVLIGKKAIKDVLQKIDLGLNNDISAFQEEIEGSETQEKQGGLWVLTTGRTPPNPTELMSSSAMRKAQEELLQLADVVIYDSTPCIFADAQVLASNVDGVIYVVSLSPPTSFWDNIKRRISSLLESRGHAEKSDDDDEEDASGQTSESRKKDRESRQRITQTGLRAGELRQGMGMLRLASAPIMGYVVSKYDHAAAASGTYGYGAYGRYGYGYGRYGGYSGYSGGYYGYDYYDAYHGKKQRTRLFARKSERESSPDMGGVASADNGASPRKQAKNGADGNGKNGHHGPQENRE